MGKGVFYNPAKAQEEELIKDKETIEQERREKYLESLRNNKNFQKYVIEGIIDKEIQANKDISSQVAELIGATPETVKSLIVAKSGGLKSAENIKVALLNS